MGSRLLRQWLLQPLLDADQIDQRLDAVEELFKDGELRAEIGRQLKLISDIERAVGRIASASANARDLIALKESLKQLPKMKILLQKAKSSILREIHNVPDLSEISSLISVAIVDDPPFVLKEGGLIKEGYDGELDEIKRAARGGKEWIAQLENEERKRTGIKSLKVGFTRVFGYYIEVTRTNLSQVPENYIRKQTLVNCERFITPELKEKESMILNADERMKDLEHKVFCDVLSRVARHTRQLQVLARILAQSDVLISLAEVAVENHYCKPKIRNPIPRLPRWDSGQVRSGQESEIRITEGRHPVVEKTLGQYRFVPNNVAMDSEAGRFLFITGPNMAGKSTYMRQIALISLMAQIGSFVPAKKAELGLIDRIFTRIGAMDDIFAGQSTFMMEMTETSNILHNATEKSLIILDEIGRGTATFDGMSIAAAVAEYIHAHIKAKTLFATHYHEITQMANDHPGMRNLNVLVKEEGDRITFLHRIVDGPADRSYGIQVAKLAGLPEEVVERAKEVYSTLEMVENDLSKKQRPKAGGRRHKSGSFTEEGEQVSLF